MHSQITFGTHNQAMLDLYQGVPERQLYYYLLNIDEYDDILPTTLQLIDQYLNQIDASLLPDFLKYFEYDPAHLAHFIDTAKNITLNINTVWAKAETMPFQYIKHLLQQYAPMGLIDGCWLQNASSAINSHVALNASLLKLYSHEIGDGITAQHHGNCFQDLIRSLGIQLPKATSWEFIKQPDLLDSSFRLPVLQLAISQFPRVFMPELLGINLFAYLCGNFTPLIAFQSQIKELGGATKFLVLHQPESLADQAQIAFDAIKLYLGNMTDKAEISYHWQRIWRGFVTYYWLYQSWLDELMRFESVKDLNYNMLELIRRKAPYAYGYHKKNVLDGKPIDAWLDPENVAAEDLLDALARSRYVKPGDSKNSLFFKLVDFKGPMFRIFSPQELDTIAQWIDSLSSNTLSINNTVVKNAVLHPVDKKTQLLIKKERSLASVKKYEKLSLRELYYHLLEIELFPDLLPFAKKFAYEWLQRAAIGLNKGLKPIPFEKYSHAALEIWLDDQHKKQVNSYAAVTTVSQSKEQVINSSVALCPLIFIDGAWVQKMGNIGICSTEVGSRLYHIYLDEVGNGEIIQNHPNVYRELIQQMDIHLPDFGSKEFCQWPGFTDEAFSVPVFWLAIANFPKSFMPEILGLNLAMELSGVGGTYRTMRDLLCHYGYSPHFVNLHNTIDNVSTGHTAWALEAIKIYMDDILAQAGLAQVQQQWQRIWTGYRALQPPKGWLNALLVKIKRHHFSKTILEADEF